MSIAHRSRLEKCLQNEHLDQIPIALWRHFPVDDQNPERLAAATIAFQNTYDFDLIKVSPSSSFCIKDWGAGDRWTGNPEGSREYEKFVIKTPDDWEKLASLNPTKGYLGDQLKCLGLIRKDIPDTPMIQTIFSPLAQAKNLIGKDKLVIHLRKYPEAVLAGLKIITRVTLDFIAEAKKTGIDGLFYAVQHAQLGILSPDEFETFERVFDIEILNSCLDLWLNMVHIHGDDILFDRVVNYPVQIINWHDRFTPPTLGEAKNQFKGIVCGGLRQWDTMVLGTPEMVRTEALQAIQETEGQRFILGTGCVLPITAPQGNIIAACQSIRQN
jgi:uroporphyrinogen decarboxylase